MRSLAIFLFCLIGFAASAGAQQAVGSVNRTQGEARAEGQSPRAFSVGSLIRFGDVVTTGAAARIEFTLADGTLVTMGERARLVIDEFVYDPARETGRASLNFVAGAFRMITGAIGKQPDRPLLVRTPVATIGIRGTDFWGGPLDDPLNVLVLEGSVAVTTPAGQVVLEPGQGTNVAGPNTAPAAATIWSQERVARAVATISFQ
jgi:hypothetical protein